MEVILLENIRRLGNLGTKIKVKNGYARNYLIPERKALPATAANLVEFEKRRAELEEKTKKALVAAEAQAVKLNELALVISAMASDEGKLYGSVGVSEIKEALADKSLVIDKREIVLPEGPLHSVGNYTIEIHLHADVIANVKVEVVAA